MKGWMDGWMDGVLCTFQSCRLSQDVSTVLLHRNRNRRQSPRPTLSHYTDTGPSGTDIAPVMPDFLAVKLLGCPFFNLRCDLARIEQQTCRTRGGRLTPEPPRPVTWDILEMHKGADGWMDERIRGWREI